MKPKRKISWPHLYKTYLSSTRVRVGQQLPLFSAALVMCLSRGKTKRFLLSKNWAQTKLQITIPSVSILAEPPVTIIDKVVDKRGTRAVAQAYLEFLYTEEGQKIVGKHYYRPRLASVAAEYTSQFPQVNVFSIDEVFGDGKKRRKPTLPMVGHSIRFISRANKQRADPMILEATQHPPGFRFGNGVYALVSQPDCINPDCCSFSQDDVVKLGRVLRPLSLLHVCWLPYPTQLRRLLRCCTCERRVRLARRMGPGALFLSGQADR